MLKKKLKNAEKVLDGRLDFQNLKQLPVMIKVIITKYYCNIQKLTYGCTKTPSNSGQILYIYDYIF